VMKQREGGSYIPLHLGGVHFSSLSMQPDKPRQNLIKPDNLGGGLVP